MSPELITGCLTKFESFDISQEQIEQYHRIVSARKPYMVCFTPRSGSSYLADLLTRSHSLGAPGEYFNADLMHLTLHHMVSSGYAGKTVVDYLIWLMQNLSSANGAFGFKVSYFDYQPLIASGLDKLLFGGFKPIFLYRKNILRQAVSLYIATETSLFHTNVPISAETKQSAESLAYDREKIRKWIRHIWLQENGWKQNLAQRDKAYLALDYEQVSSNAAYSVKSIARYLDLRLSEDVAAGESVFQKVRTQNNDRLIATFLEGTNLSQNAGKPARIPGLIRNHVSHSEEAFDSNMEFLLGLGLDQCRLVGE